jgi:hypothetical protein
MRLSCEDCGAEIAASDIELKTMLAKCQRCHAVFSFATQLGQPVPASMVPAVRPAVPLPQGVEVFREGKELVLERSWFTWGVIPLAGFALFWNGFMAVWFGISISQGLWPMALFGSLHGAVGLGMLYAVLLTIFEVTKVEVNGGKLRIGHGPLPYPGNQSMDVREIDQLYSKRTVSHNKNSTSVTFELHAVLNDRRHVKLLDGLEDSAQALYLEQELESFLGIEDRPVAGELDRTAHTSALTSVKASSRQLPSLGPRHAGGGTLAQGPGAEAGELELRGVELEAAPDCAVCGDRIQIEPERCPRCDTPHHPECWRYQGGCAAFGCGG